MFLKELYNNCLKIHTIPLRIRLYLFYPYGCLLIGGDHEFGLLTVGPIECFGERNMTKSK